MNKKLATYLILIVVFIASNVATFLVAKEIDIDQTTLNDLANQFGGIIVGILTAFALQLAKSKAMETMFEKAISDGQGVYTNAADNVLEVKANSSETVRLVKEQNEKLDRSIKLQEKTNAIEDTVNKLSKKIDLLVSNSPDMVKRGIAKQILEVKDENKSD